MERLAMESVISTEVERMGFECVKLEIVGLSKHPIVRLYIDKPGGVGVKDCALVSRSVGMVLDELDPFPGRYLLEVSSPGSDRPLTKGSHFERFTGHRARVQVLEKNGEKKTFTGTIQSCKDGVVILDANETIHAIHLTDIVKANLVGEIYKIDKKIKTGKGN